MGGWIKLHRKLQRSAMYSALNTVQRDVMIQCLLMANHSKREWYWGNEMYVCEPGQFITSLESIRLKCARGTSIKNVRTSLVKLEKMLFLANKSAKTGRLITIINWDTYQGEGSDAGNDTGKDMANDRQRGGKEVATNKNDKNEKNEKKQNPQAEKLAWLLYDFLIKIKPDRKDAKKSSVPKWAIDIEKMNRLDGRDWGKIESLIRWLFGSYRPTNGTFDWRDNIKSGLKLRAQFDTLELSRGRVNNNPARDIGKLPAANIEDLYND